ncbi:MAG TPA: SRPBCC domain-containing protein [Arachnia sp.]|nr:SRPBCC domain-containing protein [Arachnia sp.]HQD22851.1 SRPBCC domain-containing protein [Arachnia sp.]
MTVSLVVERPLDEVWDALMKPHGAEALLGEGGQLGQKGEHWAAIDGTYGVTRSFHPKEQIRFSWHAEEDAPRTVVDLQLSGDAASTRLDLAHEHLPEDADVDALAARWQAALEAIAAA